MSLTWLQISKAGFLATRPILKVDHILTLSTGYPKLQIIAFAYRCVLIKYHILLYKCISTLSFYKLFTLVRYPFISIQIFGFIIWMNNCVNSPEQLA